MKGGVKPTTRVKKQPELEKPKKPMLTLTPANDMEPVNNTVRVGRNDPCPCGSGKKFKHCCGRDEKIQ